MRRTVGNIISVLWTMLRIAVKKLVRGSGFQSGWIERFSPNVVFELKKGSRVKLGNRVRAHSGTKIKVLKNAELEIGSNVEINYNCMIICMDRVSIGEGCGLAPGVLIYDHDHDYHYRFSEHKYKTSPVEIGRNCWIGADTVILRGTKLGDNCVVGAGCVLSGEYPDNSVIVQKRETSVKTYEVRE